MKIKKLICALMCALLLVTAVMPAHALAGTDSDTHIEYGLGVQVECNSVINNALARGKIECSFVNGVSHLPEGDYTCRIVLGIGYTNGIWINLDSTNITTMTLTSTWTHASGYTPNAASFKYYVNSSQVSYSYIN